MSKVVDGNVYFPLVAVCPAASCTNGDPIALAIPDDATKAYTEAVSRQVEKQLNILGLAGGIATSGLRAVSTVTELFGLANVVRAPAAAAELGPSGIAAVAELNGIVTSTSGGINATKLSASSYAIIDLTPAEQKIAAEIVRIGDKTGDATEVLVESVSQRQGLTSLSGGKYRSNNGFDHVFQGPDGTVTIVLDSKQIANGTVQLSPNSAGGAVQLSNKWIENVLENLDSKSQAAIAVRKALDDGTLVKVIAGVDRSTGKVIIARVK